MKNRFLLLALGALVFAAPVQAQTINRVAAVVNDQIITTYQLEKAQQQAELGGLKPAQVLDRLIEEALIRQRVQELGITASEAEVEGAIEDVQKQNRISRQELKSALEAQGMSFEAYKESLRDQILRFKLMGREVQSQVEVSNGEIRDYFREHIEEFRQSPAVRLTRLSFPFGRGESAAEVRQQAQQVRERLSRGETVEEALADYPGAEGGDLGTFKAGELNREFARAIEGLSEGQSSEPMETEEGIQVLLVTEKTPGGFRKFDTVKEEIAQRLQEEKSREKLNSWAEDLRKDAYIDVRI